MINIQDEKLEQAISEAIAMKEKGISLPNILSKFPDFQDDLKDVFLAMEALKKSASFVDAPKEPLQSVLKKMPKEDVTDSDLNRYQYMGEQKGRVFQQIISNIHFLTMNKKLAGLFVMLLAIAFGSAYFWQQRGGQDTMTEKLATVESEFNQDVADIEYIAQDTSLDDLETELAMISENDISSPEKTTIDSASLDALDTDLSYSLDSLSGDFNDIEGVANDMSLDSLDSGLSGI